MKVTWSGPSSTSFFRDLRGAMLICYSVWQGNSRSVSWLISHSKAVFWQTSRICKIAYIAIVIIVFVMVSVLQHRFLWVAKFFFRYFSQIIWNAALMRHDPINCCPAHGLFYCMLTAETGKKCKCSSTDALSRWVLDCFLKVDHWSQSPLVLLFQTLRSIISCLSWCFDHWL